jgi:hypothetical protein
MPDAQTHKPDQANTPDAVHDAPLRAIEPLREIQPLEETVSSHDPSDNLSKERKTRKQSIIELSRRKYGRPRAEVEKMVYEQMGYTQSPGQAQTKAIQPSPSLPQGPSQLPSQLAPKPVLLHRAMLHHQATLHQQVTLRRRLMEMGMDESGVDYLLDRFEPERIARQLDWLPQRNAHNPAGFLMAAVEHDYKPPHDYERPRNASQRDTPFRS